MSTPRKRHVLARCITAAVVSTIVGTSHAPVARADNCSPGDFGASAGCAPPAAAGGDRAESWPPTSVDWPPDGDSETDSAISGPHGTASAPIVAPDGAAPVTHPPSTAAEPTTSPPPIVLAGSAPTTPTTAIVTPGA
ncbi:hypothetical protein FZI91_20245 [Mycobacterium sp. CBMA271]|uniref:hypothetical protein n=1 Tax=unclassified Mycobacteroides TaxID=2618759 RepID=UPI0012DD5A7C|nr:MULTISPECIES: hypothetical protein [unclassified Mycobacteroides]MUM24019.1 hypothetical protein [Mycobacteroides sp. CBMA 271]